MNILSIYDYCYEQVKLQANWSMAIPLIILINILYEFRISLTLEADSKFKYN